MALSGKLAEQIVLLRSRGLPYKKIAPLVGVSVGSVFNYAKNVQLSKEQKEELEENENKNRRKFASIFAAEKEIKIPVLNEDFANLLGHFFFDGSVFRSKIGNHGLGFTNASKKAIDAFLAKMDSCFGLVGHNDYMKNGKNVDWFEVQFYSKKARTYLLQIAPTFSTSKGACVPDLIKKSTPEIKAAFLRAFWDDEGCIGNNGNLNGTSNSKQMIDDLVCLHQEFGIDCCKYWQKAKPEKAQPNPRFEIRVRSNKRNFERFIKKIGFEHAIVTKGHNIGKYKKDVLLEKYNQFYNRKYGG